MRISIIGHPGSGKTTLAVLLSFLLNRSCSIFHGDAYITENEEKYTELFSHLESTKDWVFEHLESVYVLKKLRITPECVIALIPDSFEELKRRCSESGRNPPDLDFFKLKERLEEQVSFAKLSKAKVIVSNGVEEALPEIIKYLWPFDYLDRRFNTVVVKVASNCNLNCPYCYMYQMHDTEWRKHPSILSLDSAKSLGVRIGEYIKLHNLNSFSVIFHGGEPLLLGAKGISGIADSILTGAGTCAGQISFGIQTNGTLLNEETLSALDRYGFSVGISIDSGLQSGNEARVFHSGKPAHKQIVEGLRKAQARKWLNGNLGGALSVIDPAADGRIAYQSMAAIGCDRFDFLLRDENWNTSPARSSFNFLRGAFDAWIEDSNQKTIRTFSTLVGSLFGVYSGTESFGVRPLATLCVGTSGEYELLDVLRSTYADAWKLPFTVKDTPIEEVSKSVQLLKVWIDKYSFSGTCLSCRYFFVCGAGYLPHRYSTERHFKNPSVHCDDIKQFLNYAECAIKRNLQDSF